MTDREAMKLALKVLEGDPVPLHAINNASALIRIALAQPQSVKVWDAEGYGALCQELEGWKAKAQRKPLTLGEIAKALADAGLRPEDYREDGMMEPLVRAIEAAHGIKENT